MRAVGCDGWLPVFYRIAKIPSQTGSKNTLVYDGICCLENKKNYTNTDSLSSIITFTSSIFLFVAMAICSILKLL